MVRRLLFIFGFVPAWIYAQSSAGPNSPGAAANTMCSFSYSSTVGYNPTANVMASDNQYATASHCDCCDQNTQCLFTTGFGFNIPLTATINGIVAEVEKRASANSNMQDNPVMILKNGTETGTSHSLPGFWGFNDQYYTYGSSTDLWGTTWTPAEINNAGFGLGFSSISYTCIGNSQPAISFIDHIRITVHYTDLSIGISGAQTSGELTMNYHPQGIQIHAPFGGPMQLKVYDLNGKLVAQENDVFESNHIIPLEVKGLFFVRAIIGEQIISGRVYR